MTLTHLNNCFAQTSPLSTRQAQTDLVRSIREALLLPRPDPIKVEEDNFQWLLSLTDSNLTATSNGVEFVRVTGLNENFVDVTKNK
jgi:hypothetical protein